MKVKGLAVNLGTDFGIDSVAGDRRRAPGRLCGVGFGGARREFSRFGAGAVAAGKAGILPRSVGGVRLVVGASRGRVEVQTSGARGLPRDFAL
jgi:hypothetical protein